MADKVKTVTPETLSKQYTYHMVNGKTVFAVVCKSWNDAPAGTTVRLGDKSKVSNGKDYSEHKSYEVFASTVNFNREPTGEFMLLGKAIRPTLYVSHYTSDPLFNHNGGMIIVESSPKKENKKIYVNPTAALSAPIPVNQETKTETTTKQNPETVKKQILKNPDAVSGLDISAVTATPKQITSQADVDRFSENYKQYMKDNGKALKWSWAELLNFAKSVYGDNDDYIGQAISNFANHNKPKADGSGYDVGNLTIAGMDKLGYDWDSTKKEFVPKNLDKYETNEEGFILLKEEPTEEIVAEPVQEKEEPIDNVTPKVETVEIEPDEENPKQRGSWWKNYVYGNDYGSTTNNKKRLSGLKNITAKSLEKAKKSNAEEQEKFDNSQNIYDLSLSASMNGNDYVDNNFTKKLDSDRNAELKKTADEANEIESKAKENYDKATKEADKSYNAYTNAIESSDKKYDTIDKLKNADDEEFNSEENDISKAKDNFDEKVIAKADAENDLAEATEKRKDADKDFVKNLITDYNSKVLSGPKLDIDMNKANKIYKSAMNQLNKSNKKLDNAQKNYDNVLELETDDNEAAFNKSEKERKNKNFIENNPSLLYAIFGKDSGYNLGERSGLLAELIGEGIVNAGRGAIEGWNGRSLKDSDFVKGANHKLLDQRRVDNYARNKEILDAENKRKSILATTIANLNLQPTIKSNLSDETKERLSASFIGGTGFLSADDFWEIVKDDKFFESVGDSRDSMNSTQHSAFIKMYKEALAGLKSDPNNKEIRKQAEDANQSEIKTELDLLEKEGRKLANEGKAISNEGLKIDNQRKTVEVEKARFDLKVDQNNFSVEFPTKVYKVRNEIDEEINKLQKQKADILADYYKMLNDSEKRPLEFLQELNSALSGGNTTTETESKSKYKNQSDTGSLGSNGSGNGFSMLGGYSDTDGKGESSGSSTATVKNAFGDVMKSFLEGDIIEEDGTRKSVRSTIAIKNYNYGRKLYNNLDNKVKPAVEALTKEIDARIKRLEEARDKFQTVENAVTAAKVNDGIVKAPHMKQWLVREDGSKIELNPSDTIYATKKTITTRKDNGSNVIPMEETDRAIVLQKKLGHSGNRINKSFDYYLNSLRG